MLNGSEIMVQIEQSTTMRSAKSPVQKGGDFTHIFGDVIIHGFKNIIGTKYWRERKKSWQKINLA